MSSRSRTQALIWSIGLTVTLVMVALGLWQANAFQASGRDAMVTRLTGEPEPLQDHLDGEKGIQSAYGLPVEVTGEYTDEPDLLAGIGEPYRVVSALELADGQILPVVRGATQLEPIPPVPGEKVTLTGILLPTDPDEPAPAPTAGVAPGVGYTEDPSSLPTPGPHVQGGANPEDLTMIDNVRLPEMAQIWTRPMHAGYLTVDASLATKNGLNPVIVPVPDTAEGQARNQGYALQWWVFAIVAMAATVKLSHDAGRGTGFMAPRTNAGTDNGPTEPKSSRTTEMENQHDD